MDVDAAVHLQGVLCLTESYITVIYDTDSQRCMGTKGIRILRKDCHEKRGSSKVGRHADTITGLCV